MEDTAPITPEDQANSFIGKLQAVYPATPENELVYKFLFDNLLIYIQSNNAIQKYGVVIETPQMVRSNPAINPFNESQAQIHRLMKCLAPDGDKSELDMDLLKMGD